MKRFKKFIIILSLLLILSIPSKADDVIILLDSTGSMLSDYDGEKTKFEHALYKLNDILSTLKTNDRVGLRVIGKTWNDLDIMALLNGYGNSFCGGSTLLVPLKEHNISNIRERVGNLSVTVGGTALEKSLRDVVEYDFSNSRDLKRIILITDGGENCGGNPCGYIKEVHKYNANIKVDIIAINPGEKDIELFRCLTDNTNGKLYKDVSPSYKNLSVHNETPKSTITPNKIIYKKYMFEFNE